MTGARPGRAVLIGAGAVLGIGTIVAVHLILAWPVHVPITQPDELGYLLDARVLARGGVRSPVEYYPGFSVLLAPLWAGGAGPLTVFRETHVVQAVISALGAVLLWRSARWLTPTLIGWRRVMAVGVVCVYPAALLYGDGALSEVAFATVFLAVVVLAGQAFGSRTAGWWMALGLASGALVAVHPRALAVVVATLIAGVWVLGWRRSSVVPVGALAAGTFVGLAGGRWLLDAVRAPTTQLGAYQPDSVISKSLSVHGLISLGVEIAGQLFYLSVATVGLVPLGLAVGGAALVQVARGSRAPRVLMRAYVALCFLGVWMLSSLFANLGNRADKLIYGRYNEGVIAPLLLIALADVLLYRGARRWLAWGAGLTVLSGAIVLAGDRQRALYAGLNPINILGVMPVVSRMGGHIHVLALIGLGAAGVAVGAVVALRFPALAVALVAALFLASAVDTEANYMVPGARSREAQHDIASALMAMGRSGLRTAGCVAYDPSPLGYGDYNFFEDQFLDPGQTFGPYLGSSSAQPCGTLLVNRQADYPAHHPGAREVTAENFTAQVLWAVPGRPLYGALAAGGWLSPSTASSALPPSARARGRVVAPASVTVAAGRAATIIVRVEHGAGGAPWPAVGALHSGSGKYGVRLTLQSSGRGVTTNGDLSACLGGVAGACRRMELPETLLPGQSATFTVVVTAAAGTPSGSYRLRLGLVQEGVGIFTAASTVTVVVSA